jgi:hypothetical protein
VLAPAAVRAVNINPAILGMYLDHLLPEIAAPGDDHNYGSSAMNDVTALQVGVDRVANLFEWGRWGQSIGAVLWAVQL